MPLFSVVALYAAFSVVFDEARDTDSDDNAELGPSVRPITSPDKFEMFSLNPARVLFTCEYPATASQLWR